MGKIQNTDNLECQGKSSSERLSKHQRYYRRCSHGPEVRLKNAERNRLARLKKNEEDYSNEIFDFHSSENDPNTVLDKNDQENWEYYRLLSIRQKILEWSSLWGGYKLWAQVLPSEYSSALKANKGGKFIEACCDHIKKGSEMLATLRFFGGILPEEPWKIRQLWTIVAGLLEIMIEALTIMETRINFIQDDPMNLATEVDT
ncbi:uncharacterized protein LACBIDRAFT_324503 [Laccaria bicolor S238N-H82]|uniref:Predicted protein n=1 Tax=Laccaria bicolor (strain S238N-H82 / ATCC MYA-4686) TaxID=486041 RepID=B0D211_LACBS|nr:uncharacterized protein LACBIDRAFT_324503 [Laccaria bicolor S238N-H82]EDR11737.1 predicted protein [Laccaria bicolor S238N-H82]|eukprot:XP_001877634.1 predicted protein [Laccaria bicolor S238N-H82]